MNEKKTNQIISFMCTKIILFIPSSCTLLPFLFRLLNRVVYLSVCKCKAEDKRRVGMAIKTKTNAKATSVSPSASATHQHSPSSIRGAQEMSQKTRYTHIYQRLTGISGNHNLQYPLRDYNENMNIAKNKNIKSSK